MAESSFDARGAAHSYASERSFVALGVATPQKGAWCTHRVKKGHWDTRVIGPIY